MVRALGVASEPYIFWCGEGAKQIVSSINVPPEAGWLMATDAKLNGPSGKSLDVDFLGPLGLTRDDAWLCDLVLYSCVNKRQAAALGKHYVPLVEKLGLPAVNWPPLPGKLTDAARREEIARELRESKAEILVTLGDQPLKWFGADFGSKRSLGAYGKDSLSYGGLQNITVGGRTLRLLPLVHPRQAAGLGPHSAFWKALHETWVVRTAPKVSGSL